jgi:dodecin
MVATTQQKGIAMSVARVTELSAMSNTSFEDAIQQAIARAARTLRNVTSAWVKEQRVIVENGNINQYQVNLQITFVLED